MELTQEQRNDAYCKGFEDGSCGNVRANPYCPITEAELVWEYADGYDDGYELLEGEE
jgi:hypothetical protein